MKSVEISSHYNKEKFTHIGSVSRAIRSTSSLEEMKSANDNHILPKQNSLNDDLSRIQDKTITSENRPFLSKRITRYTKTNSRLTNTNIWGEVDTQFSTQYPIYFGI